GAARRRRRRERALRHCPAYDFSMTGHAGDPALAVVADTATPGHRSRRRIAGLAGVLSGLYRMRCAECGARQPVAALRRLGARPSLLALHDRPVPLDVPALPAA